MYKTLAILLLVLFVIGITAISVGVSGNLEICGALDWVLWMAVFLIFIICLPIAIKLGDALETLWNYD